MAINIEIIKSKTKEHFVYYTYQFSLPVDPHKNKAGKLRYKLKLVSGDVMIDKRTGHVHIIKLAEGDNGAYIQMAASVLKKHLEKGELPDKTCWAS